MTITGLSRSTLDAYRREANALVVRYDQDGDGRVSYREAERQRFVGSDSYSFSTRISETYVNRTTVYQETTAEFRGDALRRADRDGDGALDASEMVEAYLEAADSNGNGDLGWWEKVGMSLSGLVSMFERRSTVETDRRSHLEYDPQPDYYRPTPPSPDYDRPRPPRPDYDRPTPPSPDYDRPRPPRPDYDRPTPPSPNGSRPTPPRPDSDRPAPPLSGARPRPPRP